MATYGEIQRKECDEKSISIDDVRYCFIDKHIYGTYDDDGYCFSKPRDLHYAVVTGINPNNTQKYTINNEVKHPVSKQVYPVREILYYAFSNSSLKEIYIEDGVSLSPGVFSGCKELKHVRLPNDLKELQSSTFEGCVSLKQVSLPQQLQSIENHCFSCCISLLNVNFPFSVRKVGFKAFSGCQSLSEVTIDGSLVMHNQCFEDCISLSILNIAVEEQLFEMDFIGCKKLPKSIKQRLKRTEESRQLLSQRRRQTWWYKAIHIIFSLLLLALLLPIIVICALAFLGIVNILTVIGQYIFLIISIAFVFFIIGLIIYNLLEDK